MSSTFYFNHTFAELAAPNWSVPPFFFSPIRNAVPPGMQLFSGFMLNPVWKLNPFPAVNLGTTAEPRRVPH